MLDKLAGIEARYEELDRLLAEGASDYARLAEYAKERAGLERLLRNSARPFPWSDARHYPNGAAPELVFNQRLSW